MKRKAIEPHGDSFPKPHETDQGSYPRRIGTVDLRHNFEQSPSLMRKSRLARRQSEAPTEDQKSGKAATASTTPDQEEDCQRRDAFRLAVSLKTSVRWTPSSGSAKAVRSLGVVTNLSGGGALLFLRKLPEADRMTVSFAAPYDFIEERARRATGIPASGRSPRVGRFGAYLRSCETVRDNMRNLEARVVKIMEYSRDARGPVYALSLAFEEPNEDLYRLVRYFECRGLNRENDSTAQGEGRTQSATVPATAQVPATA